MIATRGLKALSLQLSLTCRRSHATSSIPSLRLFDHATILKYMKPSVASTEAIEKAFGMLAKGLVDVPIPMHIGIHETEVHS